MAKFEVGQRVRIKVGKRTGEEGTVNSLPGVGHQSFTNYLLDTSEGELLYMESELEPISTVFQPGDIVRAEKGDEIIQGKIRDKGLDVWGINLRTDSLEKDNYTLALVERTEQQQAKLVVMPTDPGMYEGLETEKTNAEDGKWHYDSKRFFYLNSDRVWTDVGWGFPTVLDGKLTRLEPVDE